jgi:hypothetical protein
MPQLTQRLVHSISSAGSSAIADADAETSHAIQKNDAANPNVIDHRCGSPGAGMRSAPTIAPGTEPTPPVPELATAAECATKSNTIDVSQSLANVPSENIDDLKDEEEVVDFVAPTPSPADAAEVAAAGGAAPVPVVAADGEATLAGDSRSTDAPQQQAPPRIPQPLNMNLRCLAYQLQLRPTVPSPEPEQGDGEAAPLSPAPEDHATEVPEPDVALAADYLPQEATAGPSPPTALPLSVRFQTAADVARDQGQELPSPTSSGAATIAIPAVYHLRTSSALLAMLPASLPSGSMVEDYSFGLDRATPTPPFAVVVSMEEEQQQQQQQQQQLPQQQHEQQPQPRASQLPQQRSPPPPQQQHEQRQQQQQHEHQQQPPLAASIQGATSPQHPRCRPGPHLLHHQRQSSPQAARPAPSGPPLPRLRPSASKPIWAGKTSARPSGPSSKPVPLS